MSACWLEGARLGFEAVQLLADSAGVEHGRDNLALVSFMEGDAATCSFVAWERKSSPGSHLCGLGGITDRCQQIFVDKQGLHIVRLQQSHWRTGVSSFPLVVGSRFSFQLILRAAFTVRVSVSLLSFNTSFWKGGNCEIVLADLQPRPAPTQYM